MTTMTTTPAGIRTGSTMPLLSPAVVDILTAGDRTP